MSFMEAFKRIVMFFYFDLLFLPCPALRVCLTSFIYSFVPMLLLCSCFSFFYIYFSYSNHFLFCRIFFSLLIILEVL